MTLEHKGYIAGPIELDTEAGVFHGSVAGLKDVVTFEGTNAREVERAFRESVDEYLAFCTDLGREPEGRYAAFTASARAEGISGSVR